jgi:hypothetical protein
MMSPNENDDFDCLIPVSSGVAVAVDCGVHIVLGIDCKSLDKVVIFSYHGYFVVELDI